MRVFITGISGLVGSALARHLTSLGWQVQGSCSSEERAKQCESLLSLRCRALPLGQIPSTSMFAEVEAVVHCALDQSPSSWERNVEGLRSVYEAAQVDGVKQQLFVSSITSDHETETGYGKQKLAGEGIFNGADDVIIRPGLVLGNGGLFGRIARVVERSPVIPLLNGGKDRVFYLGIEDLCAAVVRLLLSKRHGETCTIANLFVPEPATMEQLVRCIVRTAGRSRLLLSVPSAPVALLLKVLEGVGLKLPVSSENIRGLSQNSSMKYHSDLPSILPEYQRLEEILKTILR